MQTLSTDLKREPTTAELAESLGVSERKIEQLGRVWSLVSWVCRHSFAGNSALEGTKLLLLRLYSHFHLLLMPVHTGI